MAYTENNLKPEVSLTDEKVPHGEVHHVQAASVALAAAVAEQKPTLWSPNMRKLYAIMAVGYRYVPPEHNLALLECPHDITCRATLTDNL